MATGNRSNNLPGPNGGQIGCGSRTQSENKSRKNARDMACWPLAKYANFISAQGTWMEKMISHPTTTAMCIQITQRQFVQILHGDTVLESCSLADAAFQWRAIRRGVNILFIVRNQENSRKFRIRFLEGDDVESCVRYLRKYLPVHDADDEANGNGNAAPPPALQPNPCVTIQQLTRALLQPNQQSAQSSCNSQELSDLVRSCLMDPTFPALVEDVQGSLNMLMRNEPIDDY